MPCALVTAVLVYLAHYEKHMDWLPRSYVISSTSSSMKTLFASQDSVARESVAFSSFSFLMGFLIVFRTTQSYQRFWAGCTLHCRMGAEWFDALSSAVAFSRNRQDSNPSQATEFQNKAVRLMSMLHAATLAELEGSGGAESPLSLGQPFRYELIDVGGFDEWTLKYIIESSCKVELIFQWLQQLMTEGADSGVLNMPPPIISRIFQEMANGMVLFEEAYRIAAVPIPFPYAQVCNLLLFVHWLLVPFLTCQHVPTIVWAFVLSFIQVFFFWTLNLISLQLENPFGFDANDLDGCQLQQDFNRQLLSICSHRGMHKPKLRDTATNLLGEWFPADASRDEIDTLSVPAPSASPCPSEPKALLLPSESFCFSGSERCRRVYSAKRSMGRSEIDLTSNTRSCPKKAPMQGEFSNGWSSSGGPTEGIANDRAEAAFGSPLHEVQQVRVLQLQDHDEEVPEHKPVRIHEGLTLGLMDLVCVREASVRCDNTASHPSEAAGWREDMAVQNSRAPGSEAPTVEVEVVEPCSENVEGSPPCSALPRKSVAAYDASEGLTYCCM
eukprot:TRINITY_DN6823_c0_g1_i1.p1 TRINITY_DN6823_c0_g1~~TRINITY_DN6823_c0_g1_i1.p1  ORF type:complete len:618 (-),score=61.58 TRINITY_DN6823_c0_g1_i1:42-1706(-)